MPAPAKHWNTLYRLNRMRHHRHAPPIPTALDHSPPRVSIVIPTMGNVLVRQCLDSLRRTISSSLTYEVIVVANGAPAAARAPLAGFQDERVRLVELPVNLGFGGGCNRGAAESNGDLLVFLNDDTQVLPGWLEALVSTANAYPDVAAVGSLVEFPDGTIQEAGCVVWRDGSTLGVGRGLPAVGNSFDFLRPVDYCSGCSLLVRRAPFEAVGGFDPRYFPAYYEDVDLCFELARRGWRTLFQPDSRVVHYETASSTTLRRDYLVHRHRKTFSQKWASVLREREPPRPEDLHAVSLALEKARARHHLLLIDDRPPQRGCGSGFGVLLDAIDELDGTGWAVSVALSDRRDGDLARLTTKGVEVLRESPETALKTRAGLYDRVLISRPHNFARYAPLVRRYQPRASLTYLTEALFYRRMQRGLEHVVDPEERAALVEQMLEFRELERGIPLRSDTVVCVSDEEAALLSTVPGHCPVEAVRPVEIDVHPTTAGFAERRGLLFTPGWLAGDASPNVDGLRWFVAEVLPRLIEQQPEITLRVTGANPPASVRTLARRGVELLGYVEDLRAEYQSTRLAVVPMRVGSGVKVKCLEALQHGVPVVATSVGAEGLRLGDTRAVVVADAPESFAASILQLYESPAAWARQRTHVVQTVSRWTEQPGRTWRDVLPLPDQASIHA